MTSVWALYQCTLGWMDKGGPNGERWADGRDYVTSRGRARLFSTKEKAYLALDAAVHDRRHDWKPALPSSAADSFYVNWDRLYGVKLDTPCDRYFWYVEEQQLEE